MTKPYGRIYKNKTNVSIDARDLYNVWPVGSIYISVVNINPSEYFGGAWEVFGTGKCLVGVDTSQSEFNSIEKTGGETTHTLNISEMPAHGHGQRIAVSGGGSLSANYDYVGYTTDCREVWQGIDTYNTGDSQPHNNLQPYITVYMWKRIA